MDAAGIQKLIVECENAIGSLKDQSAAIERAGVALVTALRGGGAIYTAGNGGSAAEAMHMAEELTGRFRTNRAPLPGISLVADCTALTCIGNDFGFDDIFSRQVTALGKAGDCLVIFSTSGNSANLVKAMNAANDRRMTVISLLGRGGGAMAGKSHHEIIVKSQSTGRVQEAHQLIMHILLEVIEEAFGQPA